jgi:hypothetical protein
MALTILLSLCEQLLIPLFNNLAFPLLRKLGIRVSYPY